MLWVSYMSCKVWFLGFQVALDNRHWCLNCNRKYYKMLNFREGKVMTQEFLSAYVKFRVSLSHSNKLGQNRHIKMWLFGFKFSGEVCANDLNLLLFYGKSLRPQVSVLCETNFPGLNIIRHP